MSTEVFNRYEKKFMLDESTYRRVIESLKGHMIPDMHCRGDNFYTVCNIYYDTPDDILIKKSVSKPKYKEKLRLRSYGVPSGDTVAFLEIKKKLNGAGNKRRTRISIKDAEEFISTGLMPEPKDYHNMLVMKEISFMLKRKHIEKALYLAYDRRAYYSTHDKGLRITFDTNIRTRRYDLHLQNGSHGIPLLDNGKWLMEIKSPGNMPLWLVDILSLEKVFPVSFSKYGTEYLSYIQSHHNAFVSGMNKTQ